MDDLVERLARKLAAHTSRRRLLGMLGTALLGGVALPLLPVQRIAARPRPRIQPTSRETR